MAYNTNIEFFEEFPRQRLPNGFVGLYFAPRKFPVTTEMLSRVPLGNQDFSIRSQYYTDGHVNGRTGLCSCGVSHFARS